ncbi:MAG: S1 RNA-binding domain-containing protein [Alphaproteobacteria bacterium]
MAGEGDGEQGDPSGPSFAEMLGDASPARRPSPGARVRGRVLAVGAEEIFVDLGGSGEGMISRAELSADGAELPAVGDEIESIVVSVEPEIRLSRRLVAGLHAAEALRAAAEGGVPVQGRVAGLLKGGFEVTVAGLRSFCPLSQFDLHRVEDASSFLGQTFDFLVTEMSEDGRRIVVSRRRLLAAEAKRLEAETRSRLVPGAVLEGTVTSLAPYGAFVDLGGVQGLLHVSEISHARVDRPEDVLSVGQRVSVQVVKLDPKEGKVGLSRRALEEDPWKTAAERLRPRQVVEGRLVRATEFGAFVEVLPGVDGLVHQSELPHGALSKLREAARQRPIVAVIVLEVDARRKRVSLALAPQGVEVGERVEGAKARVGDVVAGTVEKIEPFGIVVRLGPGQTGVVPKPESGVPRGDDLSHAFPVGSEVAAEVTAVEQGGRRLRLSVARAQKREERAVLEEHAASFPSGSLSSFGDLLRKAQEKKRR